MFHITSSLFGGAAALAAWALVTPVDLSTIGRGETATVNRAAKAARLALPPPYRADEHKVVTVEVVGIRDAAIIYRDRDGRVLFQTDPVSNVTVISKGFVLPELTLRETTRSKPVQIEAPRQPPTPSAIPIGCDPAVSPIANPQLSHLTGRCLAQLSDGVTRVAMGGG